MGLLCDEGWKLGLGCDECGNWVDLGAQKVTKCGSEIADSAAVWRLCSKAAALAQEFEIAQILMGIRVR